MLRLYGEIRVGPWFILAIAISRKTLEKMFMEEWRPTTIEEVQHIVEQDLKMCDAEQVRAFKQYAIELHTASILRYGKKESVVVVARKDNEVIYWEDVEEGFNVSPVDSEGNVLEHWCNQDELGFALNAWIEDRGMAGRFAPARPLD